MPEIQSARLRELWYEAMKAVYLGGERVPNEWGGTVRELQHVRLTLLQGYSRVWGGDIPGYYWSLQSDPVSCYRDLAMSSDRHGFVYTYGNRLRKHFQGLDQVGYLVSRLKSVPGSRRAIASIYDPIADHSAEYIPCALAVQVRLNDKSRLSLSFYYRSWDLWAVPMNFVAWGALQDELMERLGAFRGEISIYSTSLHLYDRDVVATEELLESIGVVRDDGRSNNGVFAGAIP